MEEFIGTIRAFGFNFAPRGWAKCDGQLLPIAQNDALYSLIGTTYGGDGRTTFALPDLRGRMPIHQGSGPGLTPKNNGQAGGSETNTLTVSEMPSHHHSVDFNNQAVIARTSIPAASIGGDFNAPKNNVLANHANAYTSADKADTILSDFAAPVSGSLDSGATGGGSPVNNMQPYLTVNYCICLQGIYPSRS